MPSSGGTTGTPLTSTTVVTRSEPWNNLPVEQWRKIISYHPWHFWGLANSSQVPVSSACNAVVLQHAWQSADAVGREEIRRAIITAESRLREWLNYSVGRRFVVETVKYPRPRAYAHQFAASIGGDGRWLSIDANEGYIRAFGVETYTTLDAEATIVFSDEDGDGLNETFTVTVADNDLTDPDEIGVYFGADDRLDDEPLSEKWRIAPTKVSIDSTAGTITIKGSSYLLVKPILYEGINFTSLRNGIDPAESNNFVSTVTVARRYTDPTGTTTATAQAVLVWETEPYPVWALGCSSSDLSFTTNSRDPAAVGYAIARAQVRNERLGKVTVGASVYDADNDQWTGVNWGTCRQPDRVILRYECGVPLSSMETTLNQNRLPGRWDEIVARLAAAELTQRVCACDLANRELFRWQHDLTLDPEVNNFSTELLANPFGTRQGHVYAWQRVRNLNTTPSFILE